MMWSWQTCLTSVHQTCYQTSWIPGKSWIDAPSSVCQFVGSAGAFQRVLKVFQSGKLHP